MRAWVTAPEAPFVEMAEIADPTCGPDQALVEVKAVSVNHGELASLPHFWDVRMDGSTMSLPFGSVPGYELSGVARSRPADLLRYELAAAPHRLAPAKRGLERVATRIRPEPALAHSSVRR